MGSSWIGCNSTASLSYQWHIGAAYWKYTMWIFHCPCKRLRMHSSNRSSTEHRPCFKAPIDESDSTSIANFCTMDLDPSWMPLYQVMPLEESAFEKHPKELCKSLQCVCCPSQSQYAFQFCSCVDIHLNKDNWVNLLLISSGISQKIFFSSSISYRVQMGEAHTLQVVAKVLWRVPSPRSRYGGSPEDNCC